AARCREPQTATGDRRPPLPSGCLLPGRAPDAGCPLPNFNPVASAGARRYCTPGGWRARHHWPAAGRKEAACSPASFRLQIQI
ncbi:unnamed protein product, partial [Urochloa humidicola]